MPHSSEPIRPEVFYNFHMPDCASFKLALVSLGLEKDQLCEIRPDEDHVLWQIAQEHVASIKGEYLEIIASLASDVRIVVFGELMLPSVSPQEDKEFEDALAALAKSKNLYIVAGTYHDVAKRNENRHYNVCPIFVPYQSDPIHQYKFSATTAGLERTDVPIDQRLRIICTPFGNFATIVCLDVDYKNTWKKLGIRNLKPTKFPRVHLVLVPSRDDSFRISEDAKIEARPHGVALAFVNTWIGENGDRQNPFVQGGRGESIKPVSDDGTVYIYELLTE